MQFRSILTLIAVAASALWGSTGTVLAQEPRSDERTDALVLEMHQAFRRDDTRRLTQLLPQVRGHVLEPWAAYWELR
ncbi:MAG: Soluble lytic murein transglycosylase precursor, partial [Pseudomonadota bacterium]